MSVNRVSLAAPPEAVFAVLGDATRYAEWVVGAKKIRGVEGNWPAPGSRFFHAVGVGPLVLRDETVVVESEVPRRLLLEARVRPILRASVSMTVTPSDAGSEVVMEEHPVAPLPMRLAAPLLDPLTSRRNAAALQRLKDLVESRPGG